MSADLHGEAGVSIRSLEADDEELPGIDGEDDETPHASWHHLIGADRGTGPIATDDDGDAPDIPPAIRKYLLSDEADIIAVRLSRCLLLAPAAVAAGGLLLAVTFNGLLYWTGKAAPAPVYAMWMLWLAALGWAAYRWVEWRQTWFIVTGHRVMLVQAVRIIGRKVDQLPLDKMRDVAFRQTPIGRAAGYGTLDFASIGTEKALDVVNFLPWPEWLYREINALKMPDTERKAMSKRKPGGS